MYVFFFATTATETDFSWSGKLGNPGWRTAVCHVGYVVTVFLHSIIYYRRLVFLSFSCILKLMFAAPVMYNVHGQCCSLWLYGNHFCCCSCCLLKLLAASMLLLQAVGIKASSGWLFRGACWSCLEPAPLSEKKEWKLRRLTSNPFVISQSTEAGSTISSSRVHCKTVLLEGPGGKIKWNGKHVLSCPNSPTQLQTWRASGG